MFLVRICKKKEKKYTFSKVSFELFNYWMNISVSWGHEGRIRGKKWPAERGRKINRKPKLYIPSTLNIDLILWHTQLIVCAENIKSWLKSWVFHFTFQAYTMPHTLNCMYVSLFEFHI